MEKKLKLLTIHRPSTGTLEWKFRMQSSHQRSVSGSVKSGKAVGPGQTCSHRFELNLSPTNANETKHGAQPLKIDNEV